MSTLIETPTDCEQRADDESREWREIRFEVLEQVEDLPSFSPVVLEFLQLTRQEFFSVKDFEAVISKDQALVARLLKIANCGLYGRSREIRSIPEAIVLIGLDNLKRIVYAVSAQNLMTRQLMHYGYHESQGFWIHAMAVGQTARGLAEACSDANVRGEEIFVAGLLHDVGKLIMDDYLGDLPHRHVSLAMEISAVGLDHCELAGHILRQWNLPDSITRPVRFHHDFAAAGEWAPAAAMLSLARGVCREWGVGVQSPADMSAEVHHDRFAAEMEVLGMTPDRWPPVVWNIQQGLSGIEDLFATL